MGFISKLRTRPVEAAKLIVVWCFAVLLAGFGTPSAASLAVGASLVLAGLLVRAWAAGHLRRNQELATSGPYAYLRDPLYLGRLFLLCGLGVTANNLLCYGILAAGLLIFFLDYMPRKLKKETERLEERFGEEYVAYRREVRSLIPRLRPYSRRAALRWSFARFWGENREQWFILAALLLLAAMTRRWWL